MRGIHPVEYLEDFPGGLASRMKMYEQSVGTTLDKQYPAMIRVDGRTFKSYTSSFKKPFDEIIRNAMIHTAEIMCNEFQGAKLAYGQSDEITMMMTAYDNPDSTLWFDGRVQKIVSNAASVATEAFNEFMDKEYWLKNPEINRKRARFDARCFNLPFVEVNNYFIWRQRDAERNSKSMLAQAHFSQNELHGKNGNEMVGMLMERNIDWFALPSEYKVGFCIKKGFVGSVDPALTSNEVIVRHHWIVNTSIPNFGTDRDFINNFFDTNLLV